MLRIRRGLVLGRRRRGVLLVTLGLICVGVGWDPCRLLVSCLSISLFI